MEVHQESIRLILPDGSERDVPMGTTPLEVAASVGEGLARAAYGAELDGELVDLREPLSRGGSIVVVTSKHPRSGELVRHSAEHVMADAVTRLWPEAEIDAGRVDHSEKFQYDIRFPRPFTPEDLELIEGKIKQILEEDLPFERIEVTRDEAIGIFQEMGWTLKLERIRDIPEGETITLYRHGSFTDLCRGPHVQRTSQIGAVKLLEASSVYWKGDEKNERLQRIYGTAFETTKGLEQYQKALEEARARDHRRLGPELDLFSFSTHAPASPFFHPKGASVYRRLVDYVRELYDVHGYGEVLTPQIMDLELWKTSGHYENYRDAMFFTDVDEKQYAVKPMNCPAHCLIFGTRMRSYRDLPIRYADFGRLHRNERSGVISGLTRVRSFSQDDAHIFCTEEQVESEVRSVVQMILDIYGTFQFTDLVVELSTRPEKSLGTTELWEKAESALHQALGNHGLQYEVNPGDGAFYGPKIDFQVKDILGRSWQLGTVQLDYQMPFRFGLQYVDSDGSEKTPVLIHRAMLGSLERFLGILIEHTGGAFPVWLAPTQAVVLPVSNKFAEYGSLFARRLQDAGVRAELDDRNEKLGYRIREAQANKIPYMLVVGKREQEAETAALRLRTGEDLGALSGAEIIKRIQDQDRGRTLAL